MENETYLTFVLGREHFAVKVLNVLEVINRQYVTRVPQAPHHILGIINFRGEIVPVFNSRKKFNLPAISDQQNSIVIVFDLGTAEKRYTVAATTDSVKDVIGIDSDEIISVPESGINYDSTFIAGAVRRDERFILLLNIEKVLARQGKEKALETPEHAENNN